MKTVVLADHESITSEDPGLQGRTEEIRDMTEFHVADALRSLGHEVIILPFGPDVFQTIEALRQTAPELVFNLTERFEGDRRKDVNVATLLELLHLPYTGTGPTGLMLCRDKATGKRILGYHHIRVPRFISLQLGKKKFRGKMHYPAVVKPLFEDGSDGISMASLIQTENELQERVRMIHERMNQPAICEEYIAGREIYVGMLGNQQLRALPARELRFGRTDEGAPLIATSKVKWDDAYREKWQISYTHADLPADMEKQVARLSKRIFRLLHLQDYGRIDLRITPENEIVFLEANPNPDLSRDADVAAAAAKAGIDYPQLIERIVNLALRRQPPAAKANA
jgi:D-alanine-D-alanine ligase